MKDVDVTSELIYCSFEPIVNFSYVNSCVFSDCEPGYQFRSSHVIVYLNSSWPVGAYYLFQICTMSVNFIQLNIQRCVTMIYKYRLDCAVDTQYLSIRCSSCVGFSTALDGRYIMESHKI